MQTKQQTKVTAPLVQQLKRSGQPITMLTAYDATFARLLDASGVDILLVGDSLGMVIQGESDTLGVTLEDVIYHTRIVARGVCRAQVVADMPFMSYQTSLEEGVRNAGRLITEGRAEAVKLEGGRRNAELVARLTAIGIPVMGHIGLTPQSLHAMGGYRVQGRQEAQGKELLADALALQEAGAYCLVLEGMPKELAQEITGKLAIPTIGIGAGPACDGQVLVIYDLLGLDDSFTPRFVKRYDSLGQRIQKAVACYVSEVQNREFPAPEHCFSRGKRRKASERAKEQQGTPAAGAEGDGALIPLYGGKKGG